MCRDFYEVQFMCFHSNCWVVPSQDPECNGIRHHTTFNGLKVCIHCWVINGNRKKLWKTAGFAPEGRRYATKEYTESIVYPVQNVNLQQQSTCPTWKRHYPWQTRAWAFRSLVFRGTARAFVTKIRVDGNALRYPLYEMDEDTVESNLLRLIEPEDLPRDENGEVPASHQACSICLSPFTSDDPAENPEAHNGGLRQIPCPKKHVYCVGCIREYINRVTDQQVEAKQNGLLPGHEMPYAHCLACYMRWIVKVHPKRTMISRTQLTFENYQREMFINHHNRVDYGHSFKDDSEFQFVGAMALYLLAWPTFCAVHHSMGVWPRSAHQGGRLPLGQLLVVALTGVVLQAVWLVLGPVAALAYFRYRNLQGSSRKACAKLKEVAVKFWASTYGQVAWEQHLWLSEHFRNFLPGL